MAHKNTFCLNKNFIFLQVKSMPLLIWLLLLFWHSLCSFTCCNKLDNSRMSFQWVFFSLGHCRHACLNWEPLLSFITIKTDNGQALVVFKIKFSFKMRFKIVYHYHSVKSHYLRGDVMHLCIFIVLPYKKGTVKKYQTVSYAWGRQSLLAFHFKANLTTRSDFTSRWFQWLKQRWSQRTRKATKL